VVHATFGRYAGRYNETQIGAGNDVGRLDAIFGTYKGPAGHGRDFSPGFDLANYTVDRGVFPDANVSVAPGLSASITEEITTSFGTELGHRGYTEATYVRRRTSHLIEDFINIDNGTTDVVRNGIDFGRFTNIVYANTNLASRDYQALLLQTRYTLRARLSVSAYYTLMLEDEGNYEGDAANQPAATSPIGDYPEIFGSARQFPSGRLQDFQRHRLRVWSVYECRHGSRGRSRHFRLVAGQFRPGVRSARQQPAAHRNAARRACRSGISGRSGQSDDLLR
jgi:hypothetical protein